MFGHVLLISLFFFFSSRRRHTRFDCDWSSDVCSSDLQIGVVAAAQWGTSPDGIVRHGHALVIDAWGTVLADAGPAGDGLAVADLDLAEVDSVRDRLPSLANRRPPAYQWPD